MNTPSSSTEFFPMKNKDKAFTLPFSLASYKIAATGKPILNSWGSNGVFGPEVDNLIANYCGRVVAAAPSQNKLASISAFMEPGRPASNSSASVD